MKKTIISSAVFAAVIMATPAAAQEQNFSGFTATAIAGLDVVRIEDTTTGDNESKSGFAYGGALGYDYNAGSIVVGAEAEIMGTTAKYRETFGGVTDEIKAGRDLYLGARIGTPVSSNVLLYGKVGYTNARFKETISAGGSSVSAAENFDGYRVGAGLEASYNKAFGRVEYRFSDYGRQNGSDYSVQRHQVVVGIGYRF